jgi:hypothetical protein
MYFEVHLRLYNPGAPGAKKNLAKNQNQYVKNTNLKVEKNIF